MLNISLPENLEALLQEQATEAGFETPADYLVHLILQDQERRSQQARIEALLMEGVESGEAIVATDDWWEQKRLSLSAQLPTDSYEQAD